MRDAIRWFKCKLNHPKKRKDPLLHFKIISFLEFVSKLGFKFIHNTFSFERFSFHEENVKNKKTKKITHSLP